MLYYTMVLYYTAITAVLYTSSNDAQLWSGGPCRDQENDSVPKHIICQYFI